MPELLVVVVMDDPVDGISRTCSDPSPVSPPPNVPSTFVSLKMVPLISLLNGNGFDVTAPVAPVAIADATGSMHKATVNLQITPTWERADRTTRLPVKRFMPSASAKPPKTKDRNPTRMDGGKVSDGSVKGHCPSFRRPRPAANTYMQVTCS